MPISPVSQTQMKQFLSHQPGWKRGIARMSNIEKSDHSLSHITVIQDLGVSLMPKLVLARSVAEAGESTFLEFFENVVVYYSIPFLASKVLRPLFKKILPHVDTGLLNKKIGDIPLEARRQAIPLKAALILGALGMAVATEFSIAYAKPLLTAYFTGKTDFSDVVGLKKGHKHKHHGEENPDFIHKMKQWLRYSVGAIFGTLVSSLALARYGHRLPVLEKPLTAFVKHLDFTFGKNGSIALGRQQMGCYMGGAAIAYMDSCRDKLEKVEVATRLAIVMPYLYWFWHLMSPRINKSLAQKTPNAFHFENGTISPKSLNTIYAEGLQQAQKAYPKMTEKELQPYIKAITQKAVNTRLKTFAIPLATGIFGAGIGVGLLNRFWTKYRYKHQQHVQTFHVSLSLRERQQKQTPDNHLRVALSTNS